MITNFSNILINWYQQNLRDLPWRKTKDPYTIWLSEIILQQTRVAQGLPYFEKFKERFPKVNDLAMANEEEVLKLWQGLGYYSRARNLHESAKLVASKYHGKFPKTYKELIQLKGVGVYTASAIASFCNNEAVAVVDGNVYRVLARILGVFTPINSTEGEKEFKKIAKTLLNEKNSAEHNQAIMEFGALCCTPKKPNCLFCPFQSNCYSFQNNTIEELPVKLKKTKITKKYFSYLLISNSNHEIIIRKRIEKGIWQHLYEFPLVESEQKMNLKIVIESFEKKLNIKINKNKFKFIDAFEKPHKLSHQHIYAQFFEYSIDGNFDKKGLLQIKIKDFLDFPIPVLISNFIKKNPLNKLQGAN